MIRNNMPPPPGGPASPSASGVQPAPPLRRALLAAVLVVAGSALTGVVGGLIWSAVAPRVQYQVETLNPPTAYATNPETSAFIAADGWYCFIAVGGGVLIGLVAYLLAIRRYGPIPMVGAVIGAIAAAFIAAWLGHEASGGPGFDHLLATSKPGTFLYAPISLGSHGALAFWPLAAAGAAGGIELIRVLRARRQQQSGGVPMPGMESFGMRPYSASSPRGDVSGRGDASDRLDGSGDPRDTGFRDENGRSFWAPAARPSPEDDRHPGLPRRAQNGGSPGSGSEAHGMTDGLGGQDGDTSDPPW